MLHGNLEIKFRFIIVSNDVGTIELPQYPALPCISSHYLLEILSTYNHEDLVKSQRFVVSANLSPADQYFYCLAPLQILLCVFV
jgi:hypothetical protein